MTVKCLVVDAQEKRCCTYQTARPSAANHSFTLSQSININQSGQMACGGRCRRGGKLIHFRDATMNGSK
jgi:hypothetical protein